jgi:hypothetical protein
MGIAYAWERMSTALDLLATAPESLPERLEHPVPHLVDALRDAEQSRYLPTPVLESLRRVTRLLGASTERSPDPAVTATVVKAMTRVQSEELAQEIVGIAHEIWRLSTL